MRKPTYSKGEVLYVEIMFNGSIGSKRRPVVVLSADEFNRVGSKLIVAGITSNIAPPSRPGDVFLNEWGQAGLLRPSAVRGLVTTIDRNEIVRPLGKMSAADFSEVEHGIATILGLSAP